MNHNKRDTAFRPVDLRIMTLRKGPVFIMESKPLFSWKTETERAGFRQSAYRICAASGEKLLKQGKADLWDSGFVESDQQLYVEWGGAPLKSRNRVFWNVTLRDENGMESLPSETASFEVALQKETDWHARWIHFDGNNPTVSSPCPYFRKEFSCGEKIAGARLYISAKGLFEASINGQKVGGDSFVPGWTDFRQDIQYMSYDVTSLLKPGAVNAVGAILGDGWYCGTLAWCIKRNCYGGQYPELLAQMEITYADGSREIIVTDRSWKTTTGPILYSDIYNGEMYRADLEMPGWDSPGFDDSVWRKVSIGKKPSEEKARLTCKCCDPVRKIMELPAVRTFRPHPDTVVWDFGQNISGYVRVRIRNGIPNQLTLHFAEMLYPDNSLYNLNYRTARATDYYMGNTAVPQKEGMLWEPRFTFHGFRYVQIDGWQFAGIRPEDIEPTAVVLHSDMEITGSFQCGQPKVNQLYSNVCWGQRGNFLEIPTDCPQRDERLGWTGDAEVFCGTAAFNMNVASFFRKWLRDQREAQFEDGSGTFVAPVPPNIFRSGKQDSPAWADALVICPWTMYQRYGDKTFLAENYESMKKWIEFQKKSSKKLIRPDVGFGDWLALDPVQTPRPLIGTAYFAYTARLVSEAAEILGHKADAEYFRELARKVAKAFLETFVGKDGFLKVRNQTSCVLALHFDLLTPEQKEKQSRLLARLIRKNGNRLSTGFVGTASLMPTLSENGLAPLAYDLLLQEEYPSWLFSVNQGATTIWERWNSYTVKDGFGNVCMNSFNHYAYGAVAEWMATVSGGISCAAPGGKRLLFAAEPDPRMGYVKTSLETPYGKAESFWEYDGKNFRWEVSSPPNTSLLLLPPFGKTDQAHLDGKPLAACKAQTENGALLLPCGRHTLLFRTRK